MFRLSLAIVTLAAACSFAEAQQRPYEGLQQRVERTRSIRSEPLDVSTVYCAKIISGKAMTR